MAPIKIVTVVGARPQFIKAFPLSRALKRCGAFEEVMVHTGQHFDDAMSAVFFSELEMEPPRHQFSVRARAHGAMTAEMLSAVEVALLEERPHAVIVFGDTNSTLAGALAAAKLQIPLVHVEAGLRSFNRAMPEEINRIVTDHLSTMLLCPTAQAIANLGSEGIAEGVHPCGDLMYDATLLTMPIAERRSNVIARLGLAERGYAVATVHRAANTDDPASLAAVVDYITDAARKRPVVLALHPRTRDALQRFGIDAQQPGMILSGPLGFLDMTKLVHHAALVLTDSGGLQKEAYFHRVPCITLRDETEWTETIACGWNRLWRGEDFRARREIGEYGDGHAADEIVGLLQKALS
ncbi:MAG: UDP-N-acetylglucosamine 2-epimerase (non-hydrolyzing) [Alphaproteobacteria bacterium]|nr:UDP-N-acetylglucosamine 2-epimerase (non-hydrolyzing) [Alphaproteobacteria bacterium]MBV9695242.1 UDP-N-acetylglucosamine 2-epimerase (non-hydrolyzing) [Alphaproteobacteria bacterium]